MYSLNFVFYEFHGLKFFHLAGYRWDGQDRGNMWEKKWFLNQNKVKVREQDSYSMSVENM